MMQVDVERGQEFRKCIECFMCQDVCHVIRDHEENKPKYAGPRFFIRFAELEMHPLDVNDRRELAHDMGLGMCNITKCCTEVCPEHIKITDNAIIPMKERVVDARYDPVAWLGRKITGRAKKTAEGRPPPAEAGRPGRRRVGAARHSWRLAARPDSPSSLRHGPLSLARMGGVLRRRAGRPRPVGRRRGGRVRARWPRPTGRFSVVQMVTGAPAGTGDGGAPAIGRVLHGWTRRRRCGSS